MGTEDKRKNNGGKRQGSGRKPKAEELTLLKKIDRFIDTDYLIKSIVDIIEKEDGRDADKLKAIQMLMEYRWGKPKQQIEQTNINYNQELTKEDVKILNAELEKKY